jgi:hypothetical protein
LFVCSLGIAESESESEFTADADAIFAGFAAAGWADSATDFEAGKAGASGATAAGLVSGGAIDTAGFSVGEAGAGFSAPSAGGRAIETLATFFFPTAADGEFEAIEADAGEMLLEYFTSGGTRDAACAVAFATSTCTCFAARPTSWAESR